MPVVAKMMLLLAALCNNSSNLSIMKVTRSIAAAIFYWIGETLLDLIVLQFLLATCDKVTDISAL